MPFDFWNLVQLKDEEYLNIWLAQAIKEEMDSVFSSWGALVNNHVNLNISIFWWYTEGYLYFSWAALIVKNNKGERKQLGKIM